MRIVPNPAKEALNRRKHGFDFSLAAKIIASPHTDEPDDRPLGYEHEGRRVITGRIGTRVLVLVIEPVEDEGELVAKPISLRDASRREELTYWRATG